ncbi:MAG: hypothetical protein ABIQ89_04255 [Candidatus Saccharimonadales bacterium]
MNIRTEVCVDDLALRAGLDEHGTVVNYDLNLARQQIKDRTTHDMLVNEPNSFNENFAAAVEDFEIPGDLHEALRNCVGKIIKGQCFKGQPRSIEKAVVLNDRL